MPGHQPDEMLEAFKDPAVPDGAGSIGTSGMVNAAGTGSGGSGGGSGSGLRGSEELSVSGGQTWAGFCEDCRSNGVSGGNIGPARTSRDAAEADCNAHREAKPTHNPMVVP
jgi:hypothetical protein